LGEIALFCLSVFSVRFHRADWRQKSMIRPLKIDPIQFGTKVGRHMLEFGRNPRIDADREWLRARIQQIYESPKQIREGTFSGQGEQLPHGSHARGNVWFYADGNDVVVTDLDDNFVTILKDGVLTSTSFKLAKILLDRPPGRSHS
jgi:hypothetical protein